MRHKKRQHPLLHGLQDCEIMPPLGYIGWIYIKQKLNTPLSKSRQLV